MYGYDSKFLAEVSRVANTLLEEILSYLKTIEKAEVGKRQKFFFYCTYQNKQKINIQTILVHLRIKMSQMFYTTVL